MIEKLIEALLTGDTTRPGWEWRDIADTLWLADHMRATPQSTDQPSTPAIPNITSSTSKSPPTPTARPDNLPSAPLTRRPPAEFDGDAPPTSHKANQPTTPLLAPARSTSQTTAAGSAGDTSLTFRTDPYGVLPGQLQIARALRRLRRRRRSFRRQVIDLDATIEHYCSTETLIPILTAGTEPWFREVAVIVDTAPSMVVWREAIQAFADILHRDGAFDRVTHWTMDDPGTGLTVRDKSGHPVHPAHITPIDGTVLVYIISDCVSPMWYEPDLWKTVRRWGRHNPATLIQVLPETLWPATALAPGLVPVSATQPGSPNRTLQIHYEWWIDEDPAHIATPVTTFDDIALERWARVIMSNAQDTVPGVLTPPNNTHQLPSIQTPADAHELAATFRTRASPQARRLATLLTAAPVDLPIARLILDELISDGRQTHLAEVLASGLLRQRDTTTPDNLTKTVPTPTYEFIDGAREALQVHITKSDALAVWRLIATRLEASEHGGPFSLSFEDRATESTADDPGSRDLQGLARGLANRLGIAPLAPRPTQNQENRRDLSPSDNPQLTVVGDLHPVTDLTVRERAEFGQFWLDLTWTPPPGGHVRIHRTAAKPPLSLREGVLHHENLSSEGIEPQARLDEASVLANPVGGGPLARMTEVAWPQGWVFVHLTPVTTVGDQARVGTTVTVVRPPAPSDVRIVERCHEQFISVIWPNGRWPDGTDQVRVHVADHRTPPESAIAEPPYAIMHATDYERDGALRLRETLPARGCSVYLVPVTYSGGHSYLGNLVNRRYPGLLRIRYEAAVTVDKRRDRWLHVKLHSELDVHPAPPFVMVHRPDRLPLHPNDGQQLTGYHYAVNHGSTPTNRIHPDELRRDNDHLIWRVRLGELLGFVRLFADVKPEHRSTLALIDPPLRTLRLLDPTRAAES
ncbi:SAV_2336 N-terminal domain-related protein [Nocardia takedensis]|uniref:SAV_2336 N-terminal domain-related protein n=1 Tax=Nocardia takedensis TaxID=259390 RepID=UPI003F76B33B